MIMGPWRKSSKSADPNDYGQHCVEARHGQGRFDVRDSKLGDGSPVLPLHPADFAALLEQAR